MAIAVGCSSSSPSTWIKRSFLEKNRKKMNRVCCSYASSSISSASLTDQYRTLKIQPGSSEREVKKAFRQLALQYHPDVCKGNNCGVQFHRINEAYDILMSNLRGESNSLGLYESYDGNNSNDFDDGCMRGMNDPDYDLWEEWMGWEGAGIRDYSSHINPYI